jgi:putative ABC transport system permease protein
MGSQPVALINESMRRRYWDDRDPIGSRAKRGEAGADNPWYTIVGVIGDVKQRALDIDAEPELMVPHEQYDGGALYRPGTLVLRTVANPGSLVDAVRRELGNADPTAPVPSVQMMEQIVDAGLDGRRRRTVLISAFAALAWVLSILGVYALVSRAVTDRTQEIGVRMALGAGPGSVVRMLVREGVALAVIGCAGGLVAALAATRMLESFLYGVTASDPGSFAVAAVLMLSVAAAASWVPARRTTKINLRTALSYE